MSSQVRVTVSGPVGCGKSAIYGEIVLAMQGLGVPVSHANEKARRSECNLTHADWEFARDLYKPSVVMAEVIVDPRLQQGKQAGRTNRVFKTILKTVKAAFGKSE